ncbi:MAG: hypothetical protein QOJ83_1841 [Frankiales bacterium]|nr:hypothetical protein [Frankiales bacterium]
MTSKPRTASLGVGVLAALLMAAGCQSHVGTAATVGSDRISTKTLDTAYEAAARTTTGKAEGAKLQDEVLTQLVQNKQFLAVAKSQHVVVAQGDIDKAYTELVQQAATNKTDQPDSSLRLSAQSQAAAIAVMEQLAAKTGRFDTVDLYAVTVADQATAQTVLGLLTKNPQDAAAIAAKYATDTTLKANGGQAGLIQLSQLGVPALSTQKVGVPLIATVGTTLAVLRVEARLDAADFQTALTSVAKVSINPRFGAWTEDPSTHAFSITPAGSDVVAPASAVPSATTPSGSAPAPSGSAPAPSGSAPAAAPSASG